MTLIDSDKLWNKVHAIGGCGAKPDTWEKGWDDAVNTVIKLIEDAPAVKNISAADNWISVKDRLPEIGEPILIYVPNNEEMAVVSLDCDKLGFSNADNWYNRRNISFWQPLPEPPKGEFKNGYDKQGQSC